MKKTESIVRNNEFSRLYKKGTKIHGKYLVLYYMKNNKQSNYLGITVSKKIGKAVVRNRAKRLIREAYRLRENSVKDGFTFVVVARGSIVDAQGFANVDRDLNNILKRSDLYK